MKSPRTVQAVGGMARKVEAPMQREEYLAEISERLREFTGADEVFAHLQREHAPRRKPGRPGCECGGDCAYCGRKLYKQHEHDHFPIAARYGGDAVVPVCVDCHDLKDRIDFVHWPAEAIGRAFQGTRPETRILIAQLVELAMYWHHEAKDKAPLEPLRGRRG